MKKGFTLVELLMVIVIIGVLAAVAIPKFNDAAIKAKAAEIPSNMTAVANAEFLYYNEMTTYINVPEATWQTSLNSLLGIQIDSELCSYFVTDANATTFKAHGKIISQYRTLQSGMEVLLSHDGTVSFTNDPDQYLRRSVRSWASQ